MSYSKPRQAITSATITTACGFSPVPFEHQSRSTRRSHTVDKGYRKIDLQQHSFHYDKASRVEAPYVDGKRNNNYCNPTFYSSNIFNSGSEIMRSKTPDAQSLRRSNLNSQSMTDIKPFITPRDAQVNKKIDFTPVPQEVVQPVETVKQPEIIRMARVEEVSHNDEGRPAHGSKSARFFDVCTGCHNTQLAEEVAETRKMKRLAELELERNVLEHNSNLHKAEKERERQRRELMVEASKKNLEHFTQKKNHQASQERCDAEDELNIKINNAGLAAESLRSLQRYQSILDKMYEGSMNRGRDRKSNMSTSHQFNKNMIAEKEQIKHENKFNPTHVNFSDGVNKSLLDKMFEEGTNYGGMQSAGRKRASDYNFQTACERNDARKSSPVGFVEADPFKQDVTALEQSGNGRSLLDKMYQSSMDYWKRQKDGHRESSKFNRDSSAHKRDKRSQPDQDLSETEYSHKFGKRVSSAAGTNKSMHVQSLLDVIHSGSQKNNAKRLEVNQDCATFNKEFGYSPEKAKAKVNNMENYYSSPTKKVGNATMVDYDGWTHEEKGVLHQINSASAKLEQNRKSQLMEVGSTVRQQINDVSQKKKEDQVQERSFKEKPLLVCSHNANLMYCSVCSRKVPSNKISKIVAEYNKFMKRRCSVAK